MTSINALFTLFIFYYFYLSHFVPFKVSCSDNTKGGSITQVDFVYIVLALSGLSESSRKTFKICLDNRPKILLSS